MDTRSAPIYLAWLGIAACTCSSRKFVRLAGPAAFPGAENPERTIPTFIHTKIRLVQEQLEDLIADIVAGRPSTATAEARQKAREARDTLLVELRGFVRQLSARGAGDQEERYAEAMLVCLEALDRYDPTHGVPLLAFLHRCIRSERVAEAGLIHEVTATYRVRRDHLRTGRPLPTTTSLDTPVGDDDDPTSGAAAWSAIAAPDSSEDGEGGLAGQPADLRIDLATAVGALPERPRQIITEHFGLNGTPSRTLTEIAASLQLGVPAVSKILARSLRSLAATSHHLSEYITDRK